jgi:hypothetical protein
MFDLRYHVASLAAVFLALVIGILVGVGISSGGFVRGTERKFLNDKIAKLESRLDAAQARAGDLTRLQRAADTFVEESYPLLMADLLKRKRIAVVFVGPVDAATRDLVQQTLSDTGAGGPLRMRAIRVPIDLPAVDRALAGRPGLARYAKQEAARDLGRRLAQELVVGGKTPAWRALSAQLLEERSGSDKGRVDAIVVVRSVPPQESPTARLLAGFYAGLAGAEVPAVGVETTHSSASAIDAFERAGLSSVDYVDTRVGRLALALLLAGAPGGNYGLKPSARDGILPPVTPLTETLVSEA